MSWIVTTVGTGDISGSMPLVKCDDVGVDLRAARATASVCIQTSRGTRRGGVATRTRAGSGDVVSIDRFETTISSSFGARLRQMVQQVLGVVADAGPSRAAAPCRQTRCASGQVSTPRAHADAQPRVSENRT